jgi:hypothetical protein
VRTSQSADAAATIDRVTKSHDALRTLELGEGHVDPDDIAFATAIDKFDFAMEATRTSLGICLRRA